MQITMFTGSAEQAGQDKLDSRSHSSRHVIKILWRKLSGVLKCISREGKLILFLMMDPIIIIATNQNNKITQGIAVQRLDAGASGSVATTNESGHFAMTNGAKADLAVDLDEVKVKVATILAKTAEAVGRHLVHMQVAVNLMALTAAENEEEDESTHYFRYS